MEKNKLNIGDVSDNGQITIVDEDRLCYIVKSDSRGSVGLRTISKALLAEFIGYIKGHPDAAPRDARNALSGTSQIDKYEYGYESTLVTMAKMAINHNLVLNNNYIKKEVVRHKFAATFLRQAMRITLDNDANFSHLAALNKYEQTSKRLRLNGFNIGCDKSQLPPRVGDYDVDVSWVYDSQEYVLNLEFVPADMEKIFFPVYNNAYQGLFQMYKDTDGNYVLCEIQKISAKQPNSIANTNVDIFFRPYITAIKSKPFLLLAGISGTGKSRIVRELARACWEVGSEEYKAQKPRNFEMVQVKPNWHDSSELMGYVSRIGIDKDGNPSPAFIAGDFLKFVAKAWENPDVPYFLCLDEMNLAPVEQYFAEYLSVVESRKCDENGVITTDSILKRSTDKWYQPLLEELTDNKNLQTQFLEEGITIPQNLIVVGTVNMDETTFSFSRKVLDRAMTIEMNEVNLYGGLDDKYEKIGKLEAGNLIGKAVEGVDVYHTNQEVCNSALRYLKEVNTQLEGTPFKVAYRTRNEFLLYVVNNLPYNKDKDGNELDENFVIARALDEITSMKILSRIEGDDTKIGNLLDKLEATISERLKVVSGKEYSSKKDEKDKVYSVSLAKLAEMKKRLESGYTSFWS